MVRWGTASALPRYRCKACARTFNALTKTPLAKLRMKEKWAMQAEAMIEGASLAKAARRCGVHPTTAFRRQHFVGGIDFWQRWRAISPRH
jgi:transposase-like protein